jgi:hypothetical protein
MFAKVEEEAQKCVVREKKSAGYVVSIQGGSVWIVFTNVDE